MFRQVRLHAEYAAGRILHARMTILRKKMTCINEARAIKVVVSQQY